MLLQGDRFDLYKNVCLLAATAKIALGRHRNFPHFSHGIRFHAVFARHNTSSTAQQKSDSWRRKKRRKTIVRDCAVAVSLSNWIIDIR